MSARPRVGIDLLYLDADAMRGVRRYAMELTASLARERLEAAAGFDLVAFVGRVPRDWAAALEDDGVRVVCLPFSGRGRLARLFAQQVLLPFACLLLGVRLLHSLNLPPPLLSPVRTHVTVHDLLHLDVAGSVKPSRRRLRDLMVRGCIRRGMTITTISNFSRDRICERYHLDKDRVAVVYHGIALHEPAADAEAPPADVEGRYLLALGAGLPHKNIARCSRHSPARSRRSRTMYGLCCRACQTRSTRACSRTRRRSALATAWCSPATSRTTTSRGCFAVRRCS